VQAVVIRHPNRSVLMNRVTVVVVDDECPILELLQEVLEAEGYAVVTAVDGMTALELVRTVRPALVLTDIMLPRMDGLTLCARLQADPQTAHLPVLLMSAGRTLPRDVPCAGFVAKPFSLDELLAAVTRCVPRPPA
jgi:CheY-like chemotaxis protein